jgi:hypothetical protein
MTAFTDERYELDFPIRGRETSSARLGDDGSTFLYDAHYEDIVRTSASSSLTRC